MLFLNDRNLDKVGDSRLVIDSDCGGNAMATLGRALVRLDIHFRVGRNYSSYKQVTFYLIIRLKNC